MARDFHIREVLRHAMPVMLGYAAIGIPCGILGSKAGLAPWMAFLLSCTFYSGAGQFMIPSMLLAGAPLYSIAASVSFVSARQVLYSAAFAPFFERVKPSVTLPFAATVTDESFGVNMDRFHSDPSWTGEKALALNLCCMLSWSFANLLGASLGSFVDLPLDVLSFGMTSIFICLLAGQQWGRTTAVVVVATFLATLVLKALSFSGPTVLVAAVAGIVVGLASEAVAR